MGGNGLGGRNLLIRNRLSRNQWRRSTTSCRSCKGPHPTLDSRCRPCVKQWRLRRAGHLVLRIFRQQVGVVCHSVDCCISVCLCTCMHDSQSPFVVPSLAVGGLDKTIGGTLK